MLKRLLRRGDDGSDLKDRPWVAVAFSIDDRESTLAVRAFCERLVEVPGEPIERIGPGDEGLVSLWGAVDAHLPADYAQSLLVRLLEAVDPTLGDRESICVSCEGDAGAVIQALAMRDPDNADTLRLERVVLHDGEVRERAPIAGHGDKAA